MSCQKSTELHFHDFQKVVNYDHCTPGIGAFTALMFSEIRVKNLIFLKRPTSSNPIFSHWQWHDDVQGIFEKMTKLTSSNSEQLEGGGGGDCLALGLGCMDIITTYRWTNIANQSWEKFSMYSWVSILWISPYCTGKDYMNPGLSGAKWTVHNFSL